MLHYDIPTGMGGVHGDILVMDGKRFFEVRGYHARPHRMVRSPDQRLHAVCRDVWRPAGLGEQRRTPRPAGQSAKTAPRREGQDAEAVARSPLRRSSGAVPFR